MSAAFVGSIFLILAVAYVFLRSWPPAYPQSKRQVLRRRVWFREERARRAASDGAVANLKLRTWHNPTLIVSRIVEFPVGISLEFENDPPLLQRKYVGNALLRIGESSETTVVAEIMEPKPPKDNPILRVMIRGASLDVAAPGDSFWFIADSKLR